MRSIYQSRMCAEERRTNVVSICNTRRTTLFFCAANLWHTNFYGLVLLLAVYTILNEQYVYTLSNGGVLLIAQRLTLEDKKTGR